MKLRKLISLFLSVVMCLSVFVPAVYTFAAEEEAPSVGISVEQPASSPTDPLNVDLTAGNYNDWAHFGYETASSVNRKADLAEHIIGSPAVVKGGDIQVSNADDLKNYKLQFAWSDGSPVEAQTTKAFVKNGNEGVKLDFNMPAGNWELKLYTSIYNELADVVVYDENASEIGRQSLGSSFTTWQHMPKVVTVKYYCATAQNISVQIERTTYDPAQWPGLSLAAATVKAVEAAQAEIKATVLSGGTVSGGGTYNVGDDATLTATPDDGYLFKEWQVLNGNAVLADKTANPVTFKVPMSGAEIKAVFMTEDGQQDLTQYIDVRIGSTGVSNTLIGTQRPNASANPGPDTNPQNGNTGYNAKGKIRGFSQMHVSGTGVGKYGQVLLSPQIGLATRLDGHDSDKSNENPSCSEYSVTLDRYGINTSFTPAEHSTIYKFTYPESDDANLVVDLAHNICNTNATNVKVDIGTDEDGNTYISGSGRYSGGWASTHDVYFYALVNKAPKATGVYDASGAKPGVNSLGPVNVSDRLAGMGGYMTFDTQANEEILMKVGMSFKSVDQAKQWLADEIPEWDYAAVKAETTRQWNEELNKIVIEGDNISETDKIKFYTAIYHAHIMPRDRTGDIAKYGDSDMIDDHFAGWDTWRTLYPLYALTNPDIVTKTVNSFITRQKVNGYVRDSFVAGIDMSEQQGGDDIDNIIADAYAKNIPGVNWDEAYAVVKYNADNYRLDNLGWGTQNLKPNVNSNYKVLGWIPGDNNLQSRTMCCSMQLEYAYNDYLAAQMAKDLGTQEDYEKYLTRSNNWTNIWREDVVDNGYTGFIWPKNADGTWTVPREDLNFNPTKNMGSWLEYFYEASSWNYSFFVPHDVPQLIEKMGGNDTFCDRLKLGIDRGWVDYGNEPAFLSTYLFSYTTKPYLTTDTVAVQRNKFTLNGVPGNDDSGAMSSWYIFSSIGFFPNAGQNLYYFTSPYYDKTTLTLADGKKFVITANNLSAENKYIQSVTLNGKPYKSTMFTHDDIVNGGELVFEMGSTPVDYTKESQVSVTSVSTVENNTTIDLDNAKYAEWAHFGKAKDSYINRSAGAVENPTIADSGIKNVNNYWTEEDLNTWAPNSPGFTWTNGSPDQTSTVGDQDVNKRIVWSQEGLEFNLYLPAGISESELYVTGVRSRATIQILDANGNKLVDEEVYPYLGAGNGARQYKKVVLNFDCPVAEQFTVRLLTDSENREPENYSVGIAAATVRKVGIYNVAFKANGGTSVPVQSVQEGSLVTKPADPIRAGFRFDGWYKDSSFTTAWNFDSDAVTEDTTIYAKWIGIYTVKFDSNGGSAVADQTLEEGNLVAKPADPERVGNTFDGWYKDAQLTTLWDFDTDTVTGHTTIYAKWTAIPEASIKDIASVTDDSAIDLSNYADWAQFGANADANGIDVNRKDIPADSQFIGALSSVNGAYARSEINANQPFAFIWNNGTPTESMQDATKAFGWSQQGLDLEMTIPAGGYEAELYVTGIRSGATVEILDEDGNIVAEKQQLWANSQETRQYKKISLNFYCTQIKKFTVRLLVDQDDKQPADYSIGIAAATVKQLAPGVTALAQGNGTVSGGGLYNVGGNVTLTATPNYGYRLKEWKIVSGELEIDSLTANPLTFDMPASSVTIEAVFVEQNVYVNGIENIPNLSTINLSDPKYVDWAYMGYKNGRIRKAGVSDDDMIIASDAKAIKGGLTEENMDQWNGKTSPYFNWTGGTPAETGKDVRYIVWNDTGIEFDLNMPAGKHEAELYISAARAGAILEVVDQSGEVVLNQKLWNNPNETRPYRKLNLVFECETAGKYKIRLLVDQSDKSNNSYSVSLFAAGIEFIAPAITATANGNGTVTGGGIYDIGETVTLTATPDDGYRFAGWYENGNLVADAGAEYSFEVSDSRTLEAKFVPDIVMALETDSDEYYVNENVTFTTTLPSDVTKVALFNEANSGIVSKSTAVPSEVEGYNVWTIVASFGTKGSRSIKLFAATEGASLEDTGLAADFNVVAVKSDGDAALTVNSVFAPKAAYINDVFTITVKTSTSASKIGLFNSNGKALGKISQSYVDKNGERIWTITTSIATKGTRTFTVKAGDNNGNWSEEALNFDIFVVKL